MSQIQNMIYETKNIIAIAILLSIAPILHMLVPFLCGTGALDPGWSDPITKLVTMGALQFAIFAGIYVLTGRKLTLIIGLFITQTIFIYACLPAPAHSAIRGLASHVRESIDIENTVKSAQQLLTDPAATPSYTPTLAGYTITSTNQSNQIIYSFEKQGESYDMIKVYYPAQLGQEPYAIQLAPNLILQDEHYQRSYGRW